MMNKYIIAIFRLLVSGSLYGYEVGIKSYEEDIIIEHTPALSAVEIEIQVQARVKEITKELKAQTLRIRASLKQCYKNRDAIN